MPHHILTKEEAWNTGAKEVFVPIQNKRKYRFRRRWFHLRNCCTFSTFLLPHFTSDKPYLFLDIGIFEAASEVWLFQNILKHPESRLVGVDPWLATPPKLDQTFMNQCHINAQNNLEQWKDQVTLIQGNSQKVLPKIIKGNYATLPRDGYDLVIIDGDHHAQPTYEDAVNALQLVKVGGWILFDDVRQQRSWQHRSGDHVVHGLQRFLDECGDKVQPVWSHRFCETYERIN